MHTVNIYTRVTNRYSDGYRHLDKHEFQVTLRITPAKVIVQPETYDDGGQTIQFARAPVGVDLKVLARAISDTLGGNDCRHEHDCCGCELRRVTVRHLGSRRLSIHTNIGYNY